MSKFNYSKKRYIELLKLQSLQNRILTDLEKSELKKYSCLLDSILDWETRQEYISLLEKLISKEISSRQFYILFRERNDLNGEVFDNLETNFLPLSLHKKAEKFSSFIMEIMDYCLSYSEIFEYDISISKEKINFYDSKFRNSMQEIYSKIKKFLNEE